MFLKLKWNHDKTGFRPRWYGDYFIDGKRVVKSLCRWKGQPPASGSTTDAGDDRFEASRQQALAELREIVEGQKSKADRQALTARIHRARYGYDVRRIRLADLPAEWEQFPRKGKPSPGWIQNGKNILQRFIDYMVENAPTVRETGAVQREHFAGFLKAEQARGVSGRTYNGELAVLRGTFRRLDPNAPGFVEYLKDVPGADENAIHKEQYEPDELDRIFAAAEDDPLMHGLIVTAAATAMRRGDVAMLRWTEEKTHRKIVDLDAGFITVKTAKSGETVDIPIFPELRKVLEAQPRKGPFVFPEAAKIYRTRPDTLDRRLAGILAKAGFVRPGRSKTQREALPAADPGKIILDADEAIAEAGWTPGRAENAREILRRYLDGGTVKQIAADMAVSPGTVSGHLNALEKMLQVAIVRRPAPAPVPDPAVSTMVEAPPDVPRLKRANARGWHSFRTTFITNALVRGVPLDIVKLITGHRTTQVVLDNYFKPNRAQVRDTLAAAMPKQLVGETPEPEIMVPARELRQIVEGLKPSNAAKVRAQLLKMLKG